MPNPDLEAFSDVTIVARRFAKHEFEVRRLHAANPEFRAACEDLAAAIRARDFWAADARRTEEYRALVEELDAEICDFLGVPGEPSHTTPNAKPGR